MSDRRDLKERMEARIEEEKAQSRVEIQNKNVEIITNGIKKLIGIFDESGISWSWEDFKSQTTPAKDHFTVKQIYLNQFNTLVNKLGISTEDLKQIIEELQQEGR